MLKDNDRERVALDKEIAEAREQLTKLNKEHQDLAYELAEANANAAVNAALSRNGDAQAQGAVVGTTTGRQ